VAGIHVSCASPGANPPPPYRPREPERSVLYRVVAGNLETFLSSHSQRGRDLPRFVERELREFINCGVAACGFLRLKCVTCGVEKFLPFSCKGRSVCSSCCGRRMVDTAAHLVDRVFPHVPVRQWVLTLPHALRYRLAYDAGLITAVLNVFIRAVFGFLRRRARDYGIDGAQCGAVTFIQRCGDSLAANVHFHSVIFDGVYAPGRGAAPEFFPLRAPDDADIETMVQMLAERIPALLSRRGLDAGQSDPEQSDPLARDNPGLASLLCRIRLQPLRRRSPCRPARRPRRRSRRSGASGAARHSALCRGQGLQSACECGVASP
jgi:hypothetical protein